MDKRKEFNSLRNRGILAKECGTVCVSCGAMEGIEYHHILALALGGDNRFSNIVPLCANCHGKIHGCRNRMALMRSCSNGGRPKRKPPEGYEKVLPLYFEGKLTWEEAREIMSLGKEVKARGCWWVEEYADRLGIDRYEKHTVPYSKTSEEAAVSTIYYKDGRVIRTYRYIEDGEVRYYKRAVNE